MRALRHRVGRWLLRDAAETHHVSAAVNGGTVKVYMDGEEIAAAIRRRNARKDKGTAA